MFLVLQSWPFEGPTFKKLTYAPPPFSHRENELIQLINRYFAMLDSVLSRMASMIVIKGRRYDQRALDTTHQRALIRFHQRALIRLREGAEADSIRGR
ncbi:hypothetical protein AVEN_111274-1 [Araneus ventricosus]|uniref:Uncharacterized protein n=1 Tax=Araneus ventricosus TaxID=182803 RepID=A0A4Y2X7B4_ARAVE|nr:hypothetical protein AVEN_111274-1 [Araneus ventricosus]